MTNTRAKALEALTEWKISRSTGNADLEHEKAKAMSKAVEEALSEPKWKSMDDIRAYDGQEIDILLNGNARIPNVYFDDDLQQFLTAGTDVPVIIDGDPINEITHWMPLPDAPTGGES